MVGMLLPTHYFTLHHKARPHMAERCVTTQNCTLKLNILHCNEYERKDCSFHMGSQGNGSHYITVNRNGSLHRTRPLDTWLGITSP